MMVSLFYFSFWSIMRGANFARPSALHRGYVIIWLFTIGWATLVAVTVSEDRLRIGAGYIFVFLQSALFLTAFISLAELFALPKKTSWGLQVQEDHEVRDSLFSAPHSSDRPSQLPSIPRLDSLKPPAARESTTIGSASASAPPTVEEEGEGEEQDEPTERTPLFGGNATHDQIRTTFATTYRRSLSALVNSARKYEEDGEPYEYEQSWSGHLPSWAWFFQFLLLGPFIIILAGQTGLMLTDAVHQTGSDGSSLLLPYLIVVFFTILVLLPLTPFMHRITHHVPVFLLVVFIATFIYNLAASPFSANNRYKAFFIQRIDLDTGDNKVCYSGIEGYVRSIIDEMPSASGKEVSCGKGIRSDLVTCCYDGSEVAPRLDDALPDGVPPEKSFADLVWVNATRGDGNTARIEINATDTKACFLEFKRPVISFDVEGGIGWDDRFGQYPEGGVDKIKLWHRSRNVPWVVNVAWKDGDNQATEPGSDEEGGGNGELKALESGLDGTVMCAWSDGNVPGTIPALDEALKFSRPWVAITKTAEGLVEGRKVFKA